MTLDYQIHQTSDDLLQTGCVECKCCLYVF